MLTHNLPACRLLVDGPQAGGWNMAVDEALLESAAQRGEPCWRFYAWREPTLSLGYFQDYDDRPEHGPSRLCPAVRRLTGGGAILHDAELTYSVVLPGRHPLAARRDRLYTAVHRALIEALAEMGELSVVSCQLSVDPRPASGYPGYPAADGQRTTDNEQRTLIPQSPIPNPQSPFFCFQRRTPGDVLLLGHKIAGSAQRRRRGAVLQHGSLLLRRSPAAPELPGLEDITGRAIPAEAIMTPWLRRLGHILGVSWAEGGLSEMEARRAADLLLTRYARAGQLGGTPCF